MAGRALSAARYPLSASRDRKIGKRSATGHQLSVFDGDQGFNKTSTLTPKNQKGKTASKNDSQGTSGQQIAGSRQRQTEVGATSRQRAAGSGQRVAGSRQRVAGSGQHSTSHPHLTTCTQPKPKDSLTSTHAICLWIPNFPLRAEERRRPQLMGKPTALLSTTDTRKIWLLSPIARRQGAQVGMTVSQAIGLCPTLTILEPDPVYYDEQFASILAALTRVSPIIEPVELGRAYVGVDGLDRLIGNPARQIRTVEHVLGSDRGIRRWVNRQPFRRSVRAAGGGQQPAVGGTVGGGPPWPGLRLGWAQGKFASWVAACRARPGHPVILDGPERSVFLGEQSIAVLPVETDTQRRLWQLGIKTLDDLAALPREAVISQFGREGQTAWHLATGAIVEPVTGQSPPENIVTSIEFPVPVADRQILAYAINRLIERSLRDPRRIGWRVQTLRVRAALEHGASWLIESTLKDPTADCKHICVPIEAKLEQSPPTGAVESIAVEFTSLVRGTSELQLFARDASSAARAGRRRALRWASKEIQKRLKRSMLHHIIEVHPWSRLPERRYALIDYDP